MLAHRFAYVLCLTCHLPTGGLLCRLCLGSLRSAPDRLLPPGIQVISAFEHEGEGRRLVHLLKYQGVVAVAGMVAPKLARRMGNLPLVPVPRAWSRRLRYGIDPALELANELSRLTGQPVVRCLAHPLHARRRAGRNRTSQPQPYRADGAIPAHLVLVDDVLTTGGTLMAASLALGESRVRSAVTISAVSSVSNLSPRVTSPAIGRV